MTATWVLYTLHHGARQDEVGISGHYRDGIKEIYRGINADDQCDDEEKYADTVLMMALTAEDALGIEAGCQMGV